MPPDLSRYLSEALLAREDGPRVFFAGEEHTHALHHQLQLELIRAVDALDDAPTLIGLEMCWRQHQPALDAFVFGETARGGGNLETLAKRTQWSTTWGYPIELYSDILSYAREKRLRLCGLNTPYPIVRAVGRVGLAGLQPEVSGRPLQGQQSPRPERSRPVVDSNCSTLHLAATRILTLTLSLARSLTLILFSCHPLHRSEPSFPTSI